MMELPTKQPLPTCEKCTTIAESRLFTVEALDLVFANGARRNYERLKSRHHGAVMTIPMADEAHVILVSEYAAGTERYELGFPKGVIESGESYFEAANRELKEEIGMGAKQFHHLKALSSSPAYFGMMVDIVLAWELYVEKLHGDEPEPLTTTIWPISRLGELLVRQEFSEARSVAAIMLLQQYLRDQNKG